MSNKIPILHIGQLKTSNNSDPAKVKDFEKTKLFKFGIKEKEQLLERKVGFQSVL